MADDVIDLTGLSPPLSKLHEVIPQEVVRVNRTKILQLANDVAISNTELKRQEKEVSANFCLLDLARQRLPIYVDQPPNDPVATFCAYATLAGMALDRWRVALEKKAELLRKLQSTLVPPVVMGVSTESASVTGSCNVANRARKKGRWCKRRKIGDEDVQLPQPLSPLPQNGRTVSTAALAVRSSEPTPLGLTPPLPPQPSTAIAAGESPSTQLRTEIMESAVTEKASPVSKPPPPHPVNLEDETSRAWWARQLRIGLHEMIPPGSGFVEFGCSLVPRSSESPLEGPAQAVQAQENPAKTVQSPECRESPPPPSTYLSSFLSPTQPYKPEPPILTRLKRESPSWQSKTPSSTITMPNSRRTSTVVLRSDVKEYRIGPFVFLDSDSEDEDTSNRYPVFVPYRQRGKDWNKGPPIAPDLQTS